MITMIEKNQHAKGSFADNLREYLESEDPNKDRQTIHVCETPNVLLALGAKQLDMVIRANKIEECMATEVTETIKHPHHLTFDDMAKLPDLLANPVLVLKGSRENSVVALTDEVDKFGNPIIIAVHLEAKNKRHIVNRISSMYGKENALNHFENRYCESAKGYVERNIEDGNLLAINIKKAPKFLQSAGLLLPGEEENIVSFDNSITQNLNSVKGFDENIFSGGKKHDYRKI